MSVYLETRCSKCYTGEMKLFEVAIPGMNNNGEEMQYDMWCCSSCYYKFIIEKKKIVESNES